MPQAAAARRAARAAVTALALALTLVLAPGSARAQAGLEQLCEKLEKNLEQDIAGTRAELEKALARAPDDPDGNSLMALILYYYADDQGARAALAKGTGGTRDKVLGRLLDTPFAGRLGDAAPRYTGRTRGGHYFLATDMGAAAAPRLAKLPASKKAPMFDELGAVLEQIYASYSKTFKGERNKDLVSRVFVFARNEDYLAWSKEVRGMDASDAAAYYSPSFRLLVVDGQGEDALSRDACDSMFHEGFHQFIHYFLPNHAIPYWFNEGLAEYFGPSRIQPGKGVEVGVLPREAPAGQRSRLDAARETVGEWTPLRALLLADADGFEAGEKGAMHYAQSWAVMHYLIHGAPKGKSMVVRYYDLLRAGKSQQECFDAVFAKSVDQLEGEVRAYVKGLK